MEDVFMCDYKCNIKLSDQHMNRIFLSTLKEAGRGEVGSFHTAYVIKAYLTKKNSMFIAYVENVRR